VFVQNKEIKPFGSDIGGLLTDLLEGARRRNLAPNSLAAYERTWKALFAWPRPQVWIRALFLFLLPRKRIDF